MIGNAIELSNILKCLSFGFRTWLIEEFETFLIHSIVKTVPPLICLMDNDVSYIRIKLQHQTIPMLSINSSAFILNVSPVRGSCRQKRYVGLHH